MQLLTLAEQRRRMENLHYAESAAIGYLRKHNIHDYIPGQVIYNLGEYPARFSIAPTEYDEELIRTLAEKGVGLIQIHEEWNDAIRVLGADKYSSHDPAGMRAFIDLCHKYGIKILPYYSTGFFDVRDPDFSEKFLSPTYETLFSSHFRYAGCSVASPEWNNYVLAKMESILDNYDFDGIYNDMGYSGGSGVVKDGYIVGDPYLEDILVRVYSAVKERGGIVKIHQAKCTVPYSSTKMYDYLWVGECVSDIAELRTAATFEPYVVPCPDFKFSDAGADLFFAKTIPFMQFQIRADGRPVTGERINVPGIEYVYNPLSGVKEHFDAVKKWYDAHPDGPYVYSEWSGIPDDPSARGKWFDYLALYRPMVTENSVAYIDIGENRILQGEKPADVVMSLFINTDCYLCISNTGDTPAAVTLAETWTDRRTGQPVRELTLAPGSIYFLVK